MTPRSSGKVVNRFQNNNQKETLSKIAAIWHFHNDKDMEEWSIPEELNGTNAGGTLWISGSNDKFVNSGHLAIWNWDPYELHSPKDLRIHASKAKKIKIRLRVYHGRNLFQAS